MDALFPLKVNIPDEQNFEQNYISFTFFKENRIVCFLFSSEVKIEEKNISTKNKVYLLGEIVKNEKTSYIYYIEALSSNSNIKIHTSENNSFYVKINNKEINFQKNFLYNKSLFVKEDNIINKLNCFDIYEEFEIYYRIHAENKNKNSLKLLITSTINIIKDYDNEISNFSFLLTILMKNTLNLTDTDEKDIDLILSNIKNKGDLTKISKDELIKIFIARKKGKLFKKMALIYILLSGQNFEEIEKFLEIDLEELINCLEKYKNLFLHSLQLFPKYNFLFEIADSLYQIKTILKCSNSLTDFIYSLNENKNNIKQFFSKYEKMEDMKKTLEILENEKKNEIKKIDRKEKKENKKKKENPKIILYNFFDLEIALNQEFDEAFYLALDSIKKFETKMNTKIIYILDPKGKEFDPIKFLKKGSEGAFIKLLIISNMIDEKIILEQNLYNIPFILKETEKFAKKKDSLNYFEIIEIIDILLGNYNEQKYDKSVINIILFLIEQIKFENINKEFKPHFSKIKWENIFGLDYFKDIVSKMISSFINIESFEFVFTIINKLIEKDENMKIQKKKGIFLKRIIKIYIKKISFLR